MPHIGKYLALARKSLDDRRLENRAIYDRRHDTVYSLLPELKDIDTALSRQMAELFRLSLGGSEDTEARLERLKDSNLSLQMKRAEILKGQGYPIDYLDPVYSCKHCRDTGVYNDGVCSCLEELYRKELLEGLLSTLPEKDCSFERFDLSLYDGENAAKSMKAILAGCRKFADNFPNVSNGLFFQGGSGLGKTFLASCIARSLAEKGFNVCYESSVTLFDVYGSERFARTAEEGEAASKRIGEYLDCELLILDDLGSELVSSNSVSSLYSLLLTRIGKGRKTIVCTCCPDEELIRKYGEQVFSRLKGELVPFSFTGSDIRLKRRSL